MMIPQSDVLDFFKQHHDGRALQQRSGRSDWLAYVSSVFEFVDSECYSLIDRTPMCADNNDALADEKVSFSRFVSFLLCYALVVGFPGRIAQNDWH